MTVDYWTAVEELFCEAAGLQEDACKQLLAARRQSAPELVAEVESLLEHAQVGPILRTAALTRSGNYVERLLADVAPARTDMTAADGPQRGAAAVDQTIGHYRLREFLGAGGMGRVFRADDVALGRQAALKLLPPHFDARLRELLLREADACARLQHPGIATFYEAGEADGETFIAMEFVAGRLLRHRLADGPLPLHEALTITAGVLEALGHAHAAGILHRDIKPENIIITAEGAAKLLDFGIAKRLFAYPVGGEDSRAVQLDDRTSVVGSPGYFAPEQLLGEPLHPSTDLFQVGLVLFEMVTGSPAFAGPSAFARLAALARWSPDLNAVGRAGAPEELVVILRRTLARDAADRYPSAAALLRDLESVHGTSVPLASTLAILDLHNARDTAEDAWIGSGLADSVAADLMRVPGLTVVPRERVLRAVRDHGAAGISAGPAAVDVGRLLGCRWLVAGSFERSGDRLRLDTTLIDVATGQVITHETAEGFLDAIHVMQHRLCRVILRSLNLDAAAEGTASGSAHDVQAFECCARARRLFHRLEKGTMEQARELYERAVALEPDYAEALSGLAAVYAMRYPFRTDPDDLARGEEYARRAITADPGLADAFVWLGYILMRQERMSEALETERTAATLDPDHAFAPYFAGCVHYFSQRPAEAVPMLQRALEVNRAHGFAWMVLGNAHLALGGMAAARWCLDRAIALEDARVPGASVGSRAYVAECLRREGRLDDARSTCVAALETTERSDHMYRETSRGIALCCLARVAFDQGDTAAARAALDQVLAQVRGRDRTLGGGHLVVQALAGLARAGDGVPRFNEAHELFVRRDRFNFSAMCGCDDATALVALGQAALALRLPQSRNLLARARAGGAYEARTLLDEHR